MFAPRRNINPMRPSGFESITSPVTASCQGLPLLYWGCFASSAVSAVNVLEPDDIVFIQITSRLDLDQEGRDLARIGEAMPRAERNIGRLVFAEQLARSSRLAR